MHNFKSTLCALDEDAPVVRTLDAYNNFLQTDYENAFNPKKVASLIDELKKCETAINNIFQKNE